MTERIIELRGHHIGLIQDHAFCPKMTDASAELYGAAYVQKIREIFLLILRREVFIKIIDSFDELCRVCPFLFEEEAGCRPSPDFNLVPDSRRAEADKIRAQEYGRFAIGDIVSAEEFIVRTKLRECLHWSFQNDFYDIIQT